MAMSSEVQMQLSKHNLASIGGNLAVTGKSGSGAATAVLRHQASSVASIECMATVGLRSIIGVQATRYVLSNFCHLVIVSIECIIGTNYI